MAGCGFVSVCLLTCVYVYALSCECVFTDMCVRVRAIL